MSNRPRTDQTRWITTTAACRARRPTQRARCFRAPTSAPSPPQTSRFQNASATGTTRPPPTRAQTRPPMPASTTQRSSCRPSSRHLTTTTATATAAARPCPFSPQIAASAMRPIHLPPSARTTRPATARISRLTRSPRPTATTPQTTAAAPASMSPSAAAAACPARRTTPHTHLPLVCLQALLPRAQSHRLIRKSELQASLRIPMNPGMRPPQALSVLVPLRDSYQAQP